MSTKSLDKYTCVELKTQNTFVILLVLLHLSYKLFTRRALKKSLNIWLFNFPGRLAVSDGIAQALSMLSCLL